MYIIMKGFSDDIFNLDNLGSSKSLFNSISQEDKEKSNKIILSQLENNNYQALVEDITNGDNIKNTVEYEMISKKSLNDFVKDNLVNQMYLGSITIIGLYVLYQILKREK